MTGSAKKSDLKEQGRIQDLGLKGAKSSAQGARIEAPQAPRVHGSGVWGECPPPYWGWGLRREHHLPRKKINFWVSKCIFWCVLRPIWVFASALSNTSRSRPPVHVHCTSAYFDIPGWLYGSIKGAWVSAEEGTMPTWNSDSRRQLLSQLFFRRPWVWGGAWPICPLWIRHCERAIARVASGGAGLYL